MLPLAGVAPGTPLVAMLYFCETFWAAAGSRSFSWAFNGGLPALPAPFDIIANASAPFTATSVASQARPTLAPCMLRTCCTAWPQHAAQQPACAARQTASVAAPAPDGSQLAISFTYAKDQALLSGVAVYLAAPPTPAPAPAPGEARRRTVCHLPRHGLLAPRGSATPRVLGMRGMVLLNACHTRTTMPSCTLPCADRRTCAI